jgi:hypothetical protein
MWRPRNEVCGRTLMTSGHFYITYMSIVPRFTFFCRSGFELGALHLQSKHSTAWATPLVHSALNEQKMGVSWTMCQDWPPTMILPILASQVARITGVSNWHPY